ncbi:unnamed protein product, partial [Rotaria sp. Silwood2]
MFSWDWLLIFTISLNIWFTKTSPTIVFIGTYSGDGPTESKGIYAFALDDIKSTLIPL